MAIEVTCKACGNVAKVPDSAAGGKRFCKLCGYTYMVPAPAMAGGPAVAAMAQGAKACKVCGGPVPPGRRVRAGQGMFWCIACFEKEQARSAADTPAPPASAPSSPRAYTQTRAIAETAFSLATSPPDDDPYPPNRGVADATPSAVKTVEGQRVELDEPVPFKLADEPDPAAPSRRQSAPSTATPPAWPDEVADAEEEDETATALHYPCRVCDFLFVAKEIYTEFDGQFICRTCWKTHGTPTPAGVAPHLLPGVEPAPTPRPRDDNAVFCEMCQETFAPEKLQLMPDGQVLCAKCIRDKRLKDRALARVAERMAQAQGMDMKRERQQSSMRTTLLSVIGGLAGIALLLWQLKVNGILFAETHHGPPIHKTAH